MLVKQEPKLKIMCMFKNILLCDVKNQLKLKAKIWNSYFIRNTRSTIQQIQNKLLLETPIQFIFQHAFSFFF